MEFSAEGLWDDVAARLQGALNETTFQTWFGDVEGAELDPDTFVLAVPNDFTREWIESHFLELIRAAVKDATGSERRVHLRVDRDEAVVPVAVGAGAGAGPPMTLAPRTLVPPPLPRPDAAGINPKYTFDSFVIGSSNRFAHAAALAVAEAPAQAYNPLFIY